MKILFLFLCILFSNYILANDSRKQITVYIKPHAVLRVLKGKSLYQTPKGFYAKVVEVNPSTRDQFYVYDKEGVARYVVEANDVVEIENDIELLPGETGDKTYPPQSQFRTTNKIFPLESEFVFHLDHIDLSPLNDFLQTSINTTMAPRYLINTHFVSLLPVNFGFNFNYQTSSWLDQNLVDSKLSILSFGPEFKYRLLESDNYNLGIIISYEYALLYQIQSASNRDKFSAYMWNLGLQNEFPTSIGKINLGVDLRKHFLTFKNSTRETLPALNSTEYSILSMGLSVGYKIDWEL